MREKETSRRAKTHGDPPEECRTVVVRMTVCLLFAASTHLSAGWATAAKDPEPPRIVAEAPKGRPVVLPDGSLKSFQGNEEGYATSQVSADRGVTWSDPQREFPLPEGARGGGLPLLGQDGEIHVVFSAARGRGVPAKTRFIDLWHVATTCNRTAWNEPQCIWEGYCGAILDFKQLSNGRLLAPFAAWKKPGQIVEPDTGSNYTTAVYSDDRGKTWQLSPSKLTSPCYPNFNGNNYGAIEPTILELSDGRVWMLMRTQTGHLYESFSKDGIHWSPAQPSLFYSSTSPAALVRLPDRRIFLAWNHCEMPPRHNGAGVYGGRDALHGAISADEGRTWQGFREIYRDPFRDEPPPKRGDRGTAYPVAAPLPDGTVAVASGQGNRRTLLLVDPDWLLETHQEDDFSTGLGAWHVWKPIGPAHHFWRSRTQGPELVAHPDREGAKVLHVRRPDGNDPDGAVWNFPAGVRGELTCRIMLHPGFAGGKIALADRFFDPTDDNGEEKAALCLTIAPTGKVTEHARLEIGPWHRLTLTWNLRDKQGTIAIDGGPAEQVALQPASVHGLSYLRLRSAANEVDRAGMLIESVEVDVMRFAKR